MLASTTKKTSCCPRCRGAGTIEENVTLVGIAPLLDRPSGVNDEDWFSLPEPADEDREKTAICQVPVFKAPKRVEVERARPRAAAVEHEDPTKALGPRRRKGRLGALTVLVAAVLLGGSTGAVAAAHGDAWVPTVVRALNHVRAHVTGR
jgi:hypothetical protein